MSWTQNVTPDTTVTDLPGWCLRFTQSVYGAPAMYNSATEAWNAATQKYGHRQMPLVSVPVFFSWKGDLNDGQGEIDWGHVAAWVPGLGILSCPKSWGQGNSQSIYSSIEEVESWLGAKYVGYSADLNGLQIATYTEDPTPAPVPEPTPTPAPAATTYTVVEGDTLWGIATAYYGDGTRYPEIYNANVGVIGADPNLIHPGQILTIPGV
jgi:LysM repeat protein